MPWKVCNVHEVPGSMYVVYTVHEPQALLMYKTYVANAIMARGSIVR